MWAIFIELAIALPLVLMVLYALHKGRNAPDHGASLDAEPPRAVPGASDPLPPTPQQKP